jgi:two-component system, OmpR family, alkaline phosphatase synthesis response regulator PhoP
MANVPSTSKHVLVVDDEPDFAALLRSILVTAGYTVTMAHECEGALKQARMRRPDIITLDIQMPRKSGIHFYHTLKKDEAFRDVPVVVVTGLTHDREMESLIHSLLEPDKLPHPQAYVEKPIDAPRFLATIEEALFSITSENR